VTDPGATNHISLLEERLQRLEDRQQIEDFHRTYVRLVAAGDWAALPDFFAVDAVVELRGRDPIVGRSAVRTHFAGIASLPYIGPGWALTSPTINVSGDTAAGIWTVHRFFSVADVLGKPVRVYGIWEEGQYDCEYRRSAGGWLFSRMKFQILRPDADIPPSMGGGGPAA
jgi:hypothetical protein